MIYHRNPVVNLWNDGDESINSKRGSVIFDSVDVYRFMGIILAKSEFLFKISSRSQPITQTLRGSQKNLVFWKVKWKISKETWKMKKTWRRMMIRSIVQNQTATLSACHPVPARPKCDSSDPVFTFYTWFISSQSRIWKYDFAKSQRLQSIQGKSN